MNNWIKLRDESPVTDNWWLNGWATLYVPGYLPFVKHGKFCTHKSLLRMVGNEAKFYPYTTNVGRWFNPEDVMFVCDDDDYVYPDNSIVAWMHDIVPYQPAENEFLCGTCGRLCYRENRRQTRCDKCQKHYEETQYIREKLFKVLTEDDHE